MKKTTRNILLAFLFELLVYGVLVAIYFFLALHFLGDWLNDLFHQDRQIYAAMALLLIVVQGVALEFLSRGLLRLVQPKGTRMK